MITENLRYSRQEIFNILKKTVKDGLETIVIIVWNRTDD